MSFSATCLYIIHLCWHRCSFLETDVKLRSFSVCTYFDTESKVFPGLHRYVFLLYKQPGKIHFEEPFVSNRYVPLIVLLAGTVLYYILVWC
jgi:hypothetical protein